MFKRSKKNEYDQLRDLLLHTREELSRRVEQRRQEMMIMDQEPEDEVGGGSAQFFHRNSHCQYRARSTHLGRNRSFNSPHGNRQIPYLRRLRRDNPNGSP